MIAYHTDDLKAFTETMRAAVEAERAQIAERLQQSAAAVESADAERAHMVEASRRFGNARALGFGPLS